MTTTPRKERYLPERAGYATGIGIRAGIGGALGYGAKMALSGIGYVLDQFNNVVLPAAAQADQKVGKVIVEQGGKVGEAVIKVDKAQGDFWSRAFGRTPEQQKKWREEHGLEAPKYIEEPKTTVTVEVASRPVPTLQPTHYQQELGHYGDGLLTTGLLLGGLWGAIRGWSPYRRARRDKTIIHGQEQILRNQEAQRLATESLKTRLDAMEPHINPNKISLETKVEGEQQ